MLVLLLHPQFYFIFFSILCVFFIHFIANLFSKRFFFLSFLQVPKTGNLSRTKSLSALTSMSTDTLPVYITDAVRKRCMAIRWLELFWDIPSIVSARYLVTYRRMFTDVTLFFTSTERQRRYGIARIRRVETGWGCTKWGPRPWRRPSHFMQSCWTHTAAWKKCILKNCSTTGQHWSSEVVCSQISQQQLQISVHHSSSNYNLLYLKGGWPTKDERIHERVTGDESTSQWTALSVRTGEAGEWQSKLRTSHTL